MSGKTVTRVAINGFGRIGRLTFRAAYVFGRDDIEIVGINDIADVESSAFLLQHDSAHGAFPGRIAAHEGSLNAGAGPVPFYGEREPERLPWRSLGVDVVLECSGRFTEREAAKAHLAAGASRVLISAPAKGADFTVVTGVNDHKLTTSHEIVSNGSCTTNCLAPVAHVLHGAFGIKRGYMSTVHAMTADQRVTDAPHKDRRRARAAAGNVIPTSTGAARALGAVIPELDGKLDGGAIRVPALNVSLIDLTFEAATATRKEEVNATLRKAAENCDVGGVLAVNETPLVSSDFNQTTASAIVDLNETQVVDETLVRVVAWYDNEWAFSCRMLDAASAIGATLRS